MEMQRTGSWRHQGGRGRGGGASSCLFGCRAGLALSRPCGMLPTGLPCPCYFPTTNPGAVFSSRGVFPIQGWSPCLLHWQASSVPWGHRRALTSLVLKSKMSHCLHCFLSVLQTLSPVLRCLFCLIMDYLVKQKNLEFFHEYFQCYVFGILCRC